MGGGVAGRFRTEWMTKMIELVIRELEVDAKSAREIRLDPGVS